MRVIIILISLLTFLSAGDLFAASRKRGAWLYEKYCMSCHGDDGAGTPYGKELSPPVRDIRPNYLLTTEEITFLIRYGLFERELLEKGETLTEGDIKDLIRYIRGFRYLPDERRGRRLYRRLCAICHGREGQGDKNFVTPALTKSRVSDFGIARIIRQGRHDTSILKKRRRLSNTEIADIVTYLISIREG
ncbi:MAG: c-type cytochrome [Thermodesulfobacteriota bacterium]